MRRKPMVTVPEGRETGAEGPCVRFSCTTLVVISLSRVFRFGASTASTFNIDVSTSLELCQVHARCSNLTFDVPKIFFSYAA